MKKIGGNIIAELQQKTSEISNIGEVTNTYTKVFDIVGYLDLMSGSSDLASYNAKITTATHIFICDYLELPTINANDLRLVINGKIYEVRYIDNPMNKNYHYEFYLEYVGMQ